MRRADAVPAKRLIELALQCTKAATISAIYERIKPGADGRIRTVLSPVATETARMASSDTFLEESTNLQNIPNKIAMLDPLYNVRACIIAKAGHLLVEGDMSQAESRVTTAYARDYATLRLFEQGADVYRMIASRIFGVPAEQVTKEQRFLGKVAKLALSYGMGWSLFVDEINTDADITGVAISAAFGKQIVDGYHATSPELLAWWEEVWQEVLQNGFLLSAFGRRRDFLSPYVRKTDVIASKPQMTIADALSNALADAYEDKHLTNWLLLQIHDAVLMEVPKHEAKDVGLALKETMEREPIVINDYVLRVPAEVKIGERWGEMEAVA